MSNLCIPEGFKNSNFAPPVKFESEDFSLTFTHEGDIFRYLRKSRSEKVEKSIISDNPELIINPVEPVFPDRKISPHLYLEFEQIIEIEPDSSFSVFCKIPVNLGIFISSGKNREMIDIIGFSDEKYALYGDPAHGFIGRFAKSGIYRTKPESNSLVDAVLELHLINTSSNWIEVSKALFYVPQMKVFYNASEVFMKAKMKIINQMIAETEFEEIHDNNYKRAMEIYRQKKFLSLDSSKFLMEAGL